MDEYTSTRCQSIEQRDTCTGELPRQGDVDRYPRYPSLPSVPLVQLTRYNYNNNNYYYYYYYYPGNIIIIMVLQNQRKWENRRKITNKMLNELFHSSEG